MNSEEESADRAIRAAAGAGPATDAGNWFKSNLVALGSAAVLTVYAAGFMKTRAAAQRFAQEDLARQRPVPSALTSISNAGEPQRSAASLDRTIPSASVVDSAKVAPAVDSASRTPGKGAVVNALPKTVSQQMPSASGAAAAATAASSQDSTAPANQTKNANVVVDLPKTDSSAAPKTQTADTVSQPPKPKWRDGTYKGFGTSRHGDIEAEVEIKGGRIVFAYISNCLTQYPCSVFDRVVPQVISRQSAEVDYVSGATQSVNAFYYAVVEALSKAK